VQRRELLSLFGILLLFGLSLGVVWVVNLAGFARGLQGSPLGLLTSDQDWPIPIRELRDKLRQACVNTNDFEVYHLDGLRGSDHSTVVCRLGDSQATFDFLVQKFGLETLEDGEPLTSGELPPGWWSHSIPPLFSEAIRHGDEGPLYMVVHDAPGRRIFVRYEFNF